MLLCKWSFYLFYWKLKCFFCVHFTSAAVAVDSRNTTASSSTSGSIFSLPSNFVNGNVSWSVAGHNHRRVIGQDPICASLHDMGLDLSGNGSAETMYDEGDQHLVGSVTTVWLTTEADDQSSLHCVTVSTDVMSDHTGCRDASCRGGCSKISACTSLFGWASMIWSILSVAVLRYREGGTMWQYCWPTAAMNAVWVAGSLKSGAWNYEVGWQRDLCSWI